MFFSDSMYPDRMPMVNDLADEIFKCLHKLGNLYETVTAFSITLFVVAFSFFHQG